MELINDPRRAEIVITYLLGLRRAVLVDKRRLGTVGPFIGVFPQEELGLEGRPTAAPLTPEIVHSIERLQVMPREQRLVDSYFHQLLDHLSVQLRELRPTMPLARFVCIGPHFGPVLFFAVSDLWRGLLGGLERRGETASLEDGRRALRELQAWEALFPERIDPEQVAALQADLRREVVFRAYRS
jgi:hypothetical protein